MKIKSSIKKIKGDTKRESANFIIKAAQDQGSQPIPEACMKLADH